MGTPGAWIRLGSLLLAGLGAAVLSGTIGVTFFGIFLTPVFYHVPS